MTNTEVWEAVCLCGSTSSRALGACDRGPHYAVNQLCMRACVRVCVCVCVRAYVYVCECE